jgi:hypothetical protein
VALLSRPRAGHRRFVAVPALGRGGADVKVLTGEVDGEPSMLGIAAAAVIAAWVRLRLLRRR